jgi:FtsH-binding integral membrane protein
MNYYAEVMDREGFTVADAKVDERVAFIRRVYAHLLGATALFVCACVVFMKTGIIHGPMVALLQGGQWWLLLIGFMAASYAAQAMANSQAGPGVQYLGLGLYAVIEAVIFYPLMLMVTARQGGGTDILFQAGTVTMLIFGGLTAIVMLTKSDFSFLRNFLWLATIAAFIFVLVGAFTGGFSGGLIFITAMIVLFSGWILYDTSNVLHHYHTSQHVAASLALFSSLTTLFWYVIRLMSILQSDD